MQHPQQGFLLTRHWRDTPLGTEVEFWLATDGGPRQVRLPPHPSVAFIPAEQCERAELVLRGEKSFELRPLALNDFQHQPDGAPFPYSLPTIGHNNYLTSKM